MAVLHDTFEDTTKITKCDVKHSSEHEYIIAFKNTFDRKLFPNDFDIRAVEEQYTWINENITQFFPNVPQSLLNMIPAFYRQINCELSPVEKPTWMDMDKYHRGQRFVRDHYASIVVIKIVGIIHLCTFNDFLKPMIMSKRSETPYLGFKRYLSTIQRLLNWYDGEPWVKGTLAYKDMLHARKIHLLIRKKLCGLDNKQIDKASIIAKPWCPDRELFVKDFTAACPFENFGQRPYMLFSKTPYRPKDINNADMAVAQCCLISSLVLWPQNVGVHDATNEDLEALCHMWRCYGYFLGIEDEYNFCRGSLEEIKQRVRDMFQYWIIPNFKDITPEWEHMTKCFIEPFNYYPFVYLPYKVVILMAVDSLNLNMPYIYTSLNYLEWIAYKSLTFILRHALKHSSLRAIFNKIVYKIINKATNFSPEKHAELQEKSKKQLSSLSAMC
ncbi:uncharacterized protein [Linepithema humile]|uniref:uncharacterized protein n=1 Tax=Linepithema humile TaxID=83485 RepID=UPI000623191B|nr:PREDICTED: uncharacterized protein LOC105674221 [Linepithema humile]